LALGVLHPFAALFGGASRQHQECRPLAVRSQLFQQTKQVAMPPTEPSGGKGTFYRPNSLSIISASPRGTAMTAFGLGKQRLSA
jgi:hypothetical protein